MRGLAKAHSDLAASIRRSGLKAEPGYEGAASHIVKHADGPFQWCRDCRDLFRVGIQAELGRLADSQRVR